METNEQQTGDGKRSDEAPCSAPKAIDEQMVDNHKDQVEHAIEYLLDGIPPKESFSVTREVLRLMITRAFGDGAEAEFRNPTQIIRPVKFQPNAKALLPIP